MSEKSSYGDEVKAAVFAALLAGQSVSEVARTYNIPEGTIKSWRKRNGITQMQRDLIGDALDATEDATGATVAPESATIKKQIGDELLKLVALNIHALQAQAEVFTDKEWLKKQDASALAVLNGVGHDKLFRILEAFDRSDG